MWFQREIAAAPRGAGLHEITPEIAAVVRESGVQTGLCHVFVRHTSASLLIQENADPSARRDLEASFALLAPEDAPHYTHTAEGPDDMPSHIRSALTSTSETVPVPKGALALGTWQGLDLFEHRRHPGTRRIVVTVTGESR
ncbi:MAG TPA: secondary thiamine-phosphate synthase enzyme YjbQ [bacterium]|nr:secondary thiamine-phosphate synthase enzyme YjbQ [bacterium]